LKDRSSSKGKAADYTPKNQEADYGMSYQQQQLLSWKRKAKMSEETVK